MIPIFSGMIDSLHAEIQRHCKNMANPSALGTEGPVILGGFPNILAEMCDIDDVEYYSKFRVEDVE